MDLLASGVSDSVIAHRAQRTIYLDITDLMQYAENNVTLSGIQRVNASLLANIDVWHQEHPHITIVPVIPEYDRSRVFTVSITIIISMLKTLETQNGGREVLDSTILAVYASREIANPAAGDIFLMAGAFWICQHYDMMIKFRSFGVKFGLFIHDLIQINNPEYVQHVATLVFRRSLIDALTVANFVMTNSDFVAREVEAFLAKQLNFSLPVRAVKLATELRAVKYQERVIDPQILRISQGEYVLCVGTIEIRKNHLYLVKIWERLLRQFGGKVPDLVFVGKWGWKIEELQEYLNRTNYLHGRVHIFDHASDVALVHLYKHCLLTAYTTFAEGFGLPVGESLAHGKPCVTSNVTSLPEVGTSFARYVDPFDVNQGYETFREILSDRPALEKWTEDIRSNYRPKTWARFSEEFFDSVIALTGETKKSAPSNCVLNAKTFYFVGDDDIRRLDHAGMRLVTFRMARLSGWHRIEPWGCWASEATAKLNFGTLEEPGTKVSVLLQLHIPPGSRNTVCVVSSGRSKNRLRNLSSYATWSLVEGEVSIDGYLELTLRSSGQFAQPDTRSLFIGIHSLAYCRRRDLRTRTSFLLKEVVSYSMAFVQRIVDDFRPSRTGAKENSLQEQQQRTREMMGDVLAEREIAAARQPLFRFTNQSGQGSGPYQIVFPDPSVLGATQGPYMVAANCLARDFYHQSYASFCRSIGHPPYLHRKLWEYAFIVQHLSASKALRRGNKGIGFGVGVDQRLPSLFASLGCDVLATDAVQDETRGESTGKSRNLLFYPNIVDENTFEECVRFKFTELGKLDESVCEYDFCWSSGYSDRLGSITNGLEFIIETVEKTLKIGGVACHTSELNVTSNERTVETGGNVLFRRCDLETLIQRLEERGHKVERLPLEAGLSFVDFLVDVPPFVGEVHMKLRQGEFVSTSFGIVITRGR
jgi:glycosyltransferase involved in cell wall biosynthesis